MKRIQCWWTTWRVLDLAGAVMSSLVRSSSPSFLPLPSWGAQCSGMTENSEVSLGLTASFTHSSHVLRPFPQKCHWLEVISPTHTHFLFCCAANVRLSYKSRLQATFATEAFSMATWWCVSFSFAKRRGPVSGKGRGQEPDPSFPLGKTRWGSPRSVVLFNLFCFWNKHLHGWVTGQEGSKNLWSPYRAMLDRFFPVCQSNSAKINHFPLQSTRYFSCFCVQLVNTKQPAVALAHGSKGYQLSQRGSHEAAPYNASQSRNGVRGTISLSSLSVCHPVSDPSPLDRATDM